MVSKREASVRQPFDRGRPLHQFHGKYLDAVAVLQPVDGSNAGWFGGQDLRFALEPGDFMGIVTEPQGNQTAQSDISSAIHLARTTGAQRIDNHIVAETRNPGFPFWTPGSDSIYSRPPPAASLDDSICCLFSSLSFCSFARALGGGPGGFSIAGRDFELVFVEHATRPAKPPRAMRVRSTQKAGPGRAGRPGHRMGHRR